MRTFLVVAAIASGACNDSGSGGVGGLGEQCYPNGTCNVTLQCMAGICGTGDGGITDGITDGTPSDSFFPDAPVCGSDPFEPNNTIQQAAVLPLSGNQVALADVPLCPTGDVDTYSLTAGANESIQATTTYSGTPVTVSILNAGGTAIANSTLFGTGMHRVLAANLPAGTYYVQVSCAQAAVYRVDVRRL